MVVQLLAGSTPLTLSQGIVNSNVFEGLIVVHVEEDADDNEVTSRTIDG